MKKYLINLFLISAFILLVNCQVGRDIIIEFLKLDKDYDYLLSKVQLEYKIDDTYKRDYSTLQDYKKIVYPKYFWKQFDQDHDSKISQKELINIIENKWTKYISYWPSDSNKVLQYLNEQEYLRVCDVNEDGKLQSQQFPACVHAVLTIEQQSYPWKIKSLLYEHQNIGYDFDVFKTLMMKSKKAEGSAYEQHLKQLFDIFEWDNEKVNKDKDDMIGPEQGKFMEAAFVVIHLDRNADGQLSKQEALSYLQKYGKEQVFQIMDINKDNKLDLKQFISYYAFASCIDCSKKLPQPTEEDLKQIQKQLSKNSQNKPTQNRQQEIKKQNEDNNQKSQKQGTQINEQL